MKTTQLVWSGFCALALLLPLGAAPPDYWEIRPAPITTDLYAIAFGAGKFVAVGAQGMALVSYNGSAWTPVAIASTSRLRAVTHGNGLFVAGGEEGNLLRASADGFQWSSVMSTTGSERINGLTYHGGRFVGVGSVSASGGALQAYTLTSTDGLQWQAATPSANGLRAVAFGAGQFVAVGDFGTIVTSPDGLAWTPRASPITNDLGAITFFADSKFLASGMFGFSVSSENGTDWIEASRANFTIRSLATGGGYVVAAGRSMTTGRIQPYIDPWGWPGENLAWPNMLWGVGYGDGKWIAVGEQGIIVQAHVSRLALVASQNGVDLQLTGPAGRYRIERSFDALNWELLGEFDFSQPPVSQYVSRADDPLIPRALFRAGFIPE